MRRLAGGLVIGIVLGFALGRRVGAPAESETPVESSGAASNSTGRDGRVERADGARAHGAPRHPRPDERRQGSDQDDTRTRPDYETPVGPDLMPNISHGPPPPPEPGPWDDWTREQFLAALRAAIGEESVDVSDLMSTLQRRFQGTYVPLELIVALRRSGHSLDARPAVASFTDAELLRVLEERAAGGPHLGGMVERAALYRVLRGLPVSAKVVDALLASPSDRNRMAGLRLAWQSGERTRGRVLALARSDADPDVRTKAIEVLADWQITSGGVVQEDVIALVTDALTTGDLELRDHVARLVPGLGPVAAPLAVELLVTEDLDVDRVGWSLVEAAVAGGLADELLTRRPTPDTHRAVAQHLARVRDRPKLFESLAPRFGALAHALDISDLDEFYAALAGAAQSPFVAAAAMDRSETASRRYSALEALRSVGFDDESAGLAFVNTARRVVLDPTATVELRTEALDSLRQFRGQRAVAFDLERRILEEASPPAELRASVIQDVDDEWDDETLAQRLPEIRALWHRAAENDPVSWVRAAAREELED